MFCPIFPNRGISTGSLHCRTQNMMAAVTPARFNKPRQPRDYDTGAAHTTGAVAADVEIKNAEDLPVFSVDVGLIRSRNGQRPNRPKPGHNLYSIESMKPQDALATMRVRKDQLHLSIGGAPLSAPLRHSVFHCVRSSVRHSVFHSVRSTVGC